MTTCAIHQPNFLPRLSTVAKLLSADIWVVLDDVQFCRRDYQHRARLGSLKDPAKQQWLSLNVHLPNGRNTRIRDALVVDAARCQRRVDGMMEQFYARSEHWPTLGPALATVVKMVTETDRLHKIAELSTQVLLDAYRWRGTVVHSSNLNARTDRSRRLADLTRAVGADTYICGTGGARYLDPTPFDVLGLRVDYFRRPTWIEESIWETGKRLSATWALAKHGHLSTSESLG
jgi:hypothetical protein